jgi:integrase
VTKRRGNNEGSMYQRPNGQWCAQVSIEGRRLTKYAKTQKECREWLKETLAQVEDGLTVEGSKATLASYLKRWLETAKPTLHPNTWEQYERIARLHILPDLGRLRLKDLRPDHIQALYSAKLDGGLGPVTVRHAHAILHRALGQAVKWGLLRRNPADAVDKPKLARREMQTLSLDQAQALFAVAKGTRVEALLHLAVNTGLREGELLGLRWSDLDWKTGALQVQRQLQRVRGEGKVLSEPKTAAGRRLVMLGPSTLAKLRDHHRHQIEARWFVGDKWQEQGLVFCSRIGTPLERNLMIGEYKKLLAQAGLPDIRFHDLRHTAATLMLQQGVHPKVVQERLGHSKISVTLDVYSHILPSMQQDAAELLDAALAGVS